MNRRRWTGKMGVGLAGVAVLLGGCKGTPAVTDAALTSTIQTQLTQDNALAGQQVSVAVQNGVATLSGVVLNDAQRAIAARDAAGVAGVKQVQNALTVGTTGVASSGAATTVPAANLAKPSAGAPLSYERRGRNGNGPAPVERVAPGGNGGGETVAGGNGAGGNGSGTPGGAASSPQPAAPPAPVFREVTIPAGDSLPVRVTQTLDSATTQEGDTFSGVLASNIVVDGAVAIAAGTNVAGHVDAVHEAAHFKGSALLTVSLNSLTRRGDRVAVTTEPYTVAGKGRGKNTAEKAGGGAAVGAVLGGIFGGGKGAAIGAAAGGGVGAGANAVTRGQQVQIPSETVVRFRLTAPLTVRVRSGDQDGRAPLR